MTRIIELMLGVGLVALILGATVITWGQAPPPRAGQTPPKETKTPEEDVKLAAELVQLDAVITDKNGKLITGLTQADFEVLEDGQLQALSFFAAELRKPIDDLAFDLKQPATPLDKLATPSTAESGRVILIVFDNLHMDVGNFMRARQSLLRFIDDNVLDRDRVAIITTGGGLGLLQQLTDDKRIMKAAINRLTPGFGIEDNDNPRMTEYHVRLIQMGDTDALEAAIEATIIANGLKDMPNAYEIAKSMVEGRVRRTIAEGNQASANTLITLQNVIRAMAPIKGRKLALFVSDGFPITGSDNDARSRLPDVIDAATRAGVVIYSLDARGLYVSVPGGDASMRGTLDERGRFLSIQRAGLEANKDLLNALARDTGGFPLFDSNDLQTSLKRTLEDNSAYYLLAYYPTNTKADGRFREIKVQIKGRPELRVRTRKGYYAPGRKNLVANKPKEGEVAVSEGFDQVVFKSLGSPVPSSDISLKLALNFVDVPKKGPLAIMDVVVDSKSLQFNKTDVSNLNANLRPTPAANTEAPPAPAPAQPDERYAANLDLYIMAFDSSGKQAASTKKTITMHLREQTHEFVMDSGLSYHDTLALAPGTYQVRLAARQRETGLIGTTSDWIEVPDLKKNQLALSSIFLRATPPDEFEDEPEEEPTAEKKESEQSYFRNQANRLIPEGSNLELFAVIYNAKALNGKADLVVQTQILRDNTVVYSSPLRSIGDTAADLARIPYGVRLALKDLSPGPYVLQFTAIDRVAKANAIQRVDFEIEE